MRLSMRRCLIVWKRAITTDASLDAAQDSDNITETQSTTTLNEPHPQGEGSEEKDARAVGSQTKEKVKSLEKAKGSQSTIKQEGEKYGQVESSDDDLDEEDASKQGRKNDKTNPMLHESDFDGFDDETVDAATTGVSTASAPVTTAGVAISTAEPRTPPTTTTVFDDEDVTMAMAQTLIKMKEEKAKEKGVAFKDVEDSSRPVRSITTLQPLPSIDPKDKGKGILVEGEPVKVKRKDQGLAQIESDAELAHRLHEEELAEIERIQKEKAAQEEYQCCNLYREDIEQYTIEERGKFLAETIAAQRKFRAAQRAAKIRRRLHTKTQLRNLMMTYLKNMGGYKHSQLKGKTYEEIQGLYEREQKFIHDFVPMDSEKEEKKSMEPESEGKKSKRLKRTTGSYATQKSPKKPKVMKSVKNVTEEEAAEYEKEKEELRLSLKIISGDDSEVNYEPLSKRFPIVNWEYKLLGNVDAKDMLVQERFQDHPLEGHDLLLWGDLRMLFNPDEKDEL
ncbi:hypothetical protein Tco_0640613 [Tanacetum coccineum]